MKSLTTITLFLLINIGFISSVSADNKVYINNELIEQKILNRISQQYNIKIQDGRYWYDNNTGGWGIEGGPTVHYIMPNMKLGGRLAANASAGNTNVFVNGRELHQQDVAQLSKFMMVMPGRYWVDANSNFGYENGPAIGNFRVLINQKQASQRSRSKITAGWYTGIGVGDGYVIGSDWSVSGY